MTSIDPDKLLIERSAQLLEAEVDGEMVALHVDNGQCYGFNGTAARIWTLLDRPKTLTELCVDLSAEFDLSPEDAPEEVLPFLEELKRDGLVSIRPSPAA